MEKASHRFACFPVASWLAAWLIPRCLLFDCSIALRLEAEAWRFTNLAMVGKVIDIIKAGKSMNSQGGDGVLACLRVLLLL